MTRDGAFGPDGYSGVSGVAARPRQSSSAIEKKNGLVISQATAQCAVRTNERSTNYLNGIAVARFGCVIVDFSGAEAYKNGVKVPLTAHEVKVLRYFIDNPARNFSARIVGHGVGLQHLPDYSNCGQPDYETPEEARAGSEESVTLRHCAWYRLQVCTRRIRKRSARQTSEFASQRSKKYRMGERA
jgi:hypothetical protein